MSLRAFFSRLLTPLSNSNRSEHGAAHGRQQKRTWRYYLAQFLIVTTLLLSAIWLLMALWYQFGMRSIITWLATIVIVGVLVTLLGSRYWPKAAKRLNNQQANSQLTTQAKISKNTNKKSASKWLMGLYGAIWFVGIGWFIALVSEAFIFAFAYKWFKKDRALYFIILASILYTVRWILFAVSKEPLVILSGQLLHGLTFGIFYLSSLDYISRLIPSRLKSSGHLIFYSVFFGLSGIVGSIGGGLIIDHFSGNHLYYALGLMSLIGTFLLVLYYFKNQSNNKL